MAYGRLWTDAPTNPTDLIPPPPPIYRSQGPVRCPCIPLREPSLRRATPRLCKVPIPIRYFAALINAFDVVVVDSEENPPSLHYCENERLKSGDHEVAEEATASHGAFRSQISPLKEANATFESRRVRRETPILIRQTCTKWGHFPPISMQTILICCSTPTLHNVSLSLLLDSIKQPQMDGSGLPNWKSRCL